MTFAKALNSLVKIGFAITLFVFFLLGFRIFSNAYDNSRIIYGIAVIGVGIIVSFAVWGLVGTISEIGMDTVVIRKSLEHINEDQQEALMHLRVMKQNQASDGTQTQPAATQQQTSSGSMIDTRG